MADPLSDVPALIVGGAYETGLLTQESVRSISAIKDSARSIARGLGSPARHERAFLISMMPDDSGSIFSPLTTNSSWVARGHNDIIDELSQLTASAPEDKILLHTRYLNGKVLNPYMQLNSAQRMTSANYREGGGTPLYDQTVILLGTVITKTVQLKAQDGKVRTFTLLISDGADRHSETATADAVACIVRDMILTGDHIVAAMGVHDGETDYRAVFRQMGIKPGWIFSVDDSRDAIRKAFHAILTELRQLTTGSDEQFARLALGPGPVS